jgi:acylaminoacyl-peptidase
MSEIAKAVKEVFAVPVLAAARIVHISEEEHTVQIQVDHLIRDFPGDPTDVKSNVKAKKLITRQLTAVDVPARATKFRGPVEVADPQIVYRQDSPSFIWRVVALMKADASKAKPALQVFKENTFVGEFDMSSVHGAFCTGHFGWTAWDEDAGHFIYQAEMKEAEDKPIDYRWNPNWGETYPSVRKPAVFVIDLNDCAKVVASLEPNEEFQPSQLIKTLPGVVHFVGIEVIPGRKYGVAYCPNRPNHLYSWEYTEVTKAIKCEITNPDKHAEAIQYPVFNAASKKISFFGTYLGGSHYHAHSLYAYDIEGKTIHKVVDGEADVIRCGDKAVNGLFPSWSPIMPAATRLPKDGSIFVTSYNKSEVPLLRILPCGSIRVVDCPAEMEHTCQIHQILGDYILVSTSTRQSPSRLYLGIISDDETKWVPVPSPASVAPIKQELLRIADTIEVVLTKPANSASDLPLILFPHGGPNHAYSCEWSPFCALAARLGYAVAAINYTGSAGYGQKGIRALEGRIGELDVDDCIAATRHLVEKCGFDAGRLFMFGGSHGGFLVAHLSARTEFGWRAVVAHNAVIDLPSMVMTSDIPEFAFGQMGMEYDLRRPRPPTPEELARMQAASPTSRVASVKAPTLVVIGEEDLRVPPSQGKAWYGWLKGLGVETEILSFPSTGHAIDSPEGQYHEEIAIFDWFARH